jgi:predicted aspartyl protease
MARARYRYAPGDPPAPSVLLNLTNPTTGAVAQDVSGLLDTGADWTVIPVRVAAALSLPQLDREVVQGFDGRRQEVPTYALIRQVRDLPPVRVEVLGSADIPHAILGRDVANRYRITLDGPGQRMDISDE